VTAAANSSSTNTINTTTTASASNTTAPQFHQQQNQNHPNQHNMQPQFQQPIQQQMWNFLQQHPHHPLAQNPFAGQPPPQNHGVFGMMNGGFGQNSAPQHPGQNQAGMMMNFMGDQNHGMPGMHHQSQQMQMQMAQSMNENMSYVDYYQTESGEIYYSFSPADNHQQQQINYDHPSVELDASQTGSSGNLLQTTTGSDREITTAILSMDSTGLCFPVHSDAEYGMQNQNGEMSQQNVVANGQIQCTVMAPTMDGTQGFISPMVDQIQYMQQQAFNPAIMQQQQQQQQQVLNPMMQQEQVLNLDMQQQQHSVLGTNDGASQNFYMYSENVSQPVIDLTQQQVQEGQNSLNTEQTNPESSDGTTMHFNLNPQEMQLTGLEQNQKITQNQHPGENYTAHHPAHHPSQTQQHYTAAAAYHHHHTNGPHPNQQQAGQNPNHPHPHHHNIHPFNMASHQLSTSAEPFIPQDHSTGYVSMEMDPNYQAMMYLQAQNSQNQVMGYSGQNLSESNIVQKIEDFQPKPIAMKHENSNVPNNVFDPSQPYGQMQNSSEQNHNQINNNFGNPHSNSYGHHHQTNSSSHNTTTPIPGSGTTPIPDPPSSQMDPRSNSNSYGNPQSVKFQSYANVTSGSGLKSRPSKNFNDNFNQSSMKQSVGRPANYPASDEASLCQVLSDICGFTLEQSKRIAINLREKGAHADVLKGWYGVFINIRKNTD